MKLPLADLRLSEEFRTTLTNQPGRVLDWGHVRETHRKPGPHPRLPVVLCQMGSRLRLLRPELVVFVDEDRPHWSQDRRPEPAVRWDRYVGSRDEEDEE